MIIYIAGLHTTGVKRESYYSKFNDRERNVIDNLEYLLESYHYIHKDAFVNVIRENNDKVFLDSGAFSAFTLGTTIDLQKYCDYIHKNIDIIKKDEGILLASVLDGIGDPLKTYANQLEMERLGVTPLPCFHYGEDERYLEWYIKNYEYITIGGMVPISTSQLKLWLDRIWNKYLVSGDGKPRLKVHGFGVTSVELMKSYPWYSCDSSTWVQACAFGEIFTFEHGRISVSEHSPNTKKSDAHAFTLKDNEKEYFSKLLETQGFSIDRLSTVYQSRAAYNIWNFERVAEAISDGSISYDRSCIRSLF